MEQLIGCILKALLVTRWSEGGSHPYEADFYRKGYLDVEGIGYVDFDAQSPGISSTRPPDLLSHEDSPMIEGSAIQDVLLAVMHYTKIPKEPDLIMDIPSELIVTLDNGQSIVTQSYKENGHALYVGPGLLDIEEYRKSIEDTVCKIHRYSEWQTTKNAEQDVDPNA